MGNNPDSREVVIKIYGWIPFSDSLPVNNDRFWEFWKGEIRSGAAGASHQERLFEIKVRSPFPERRFQEGVPLKAWKDPIEGPDIFGERIFIGFGKLHIVKFGKRLGGPKPLFQIPLVSGTAPFGGLPRSRFPILYPLATLSKAWGADQRSQRDPRENEEFPSSIAETFSHFLEKSMNENFMKNSPLVGRFNIAHSCILALEPAGKA